MLLQGTRPRSASDTLMSRRNIPTSPLLTLSPSRGRWSSGRGCAAGNEPRALGLGRVCAEAGRGNTGVRYRRQLAGNECWVQGIAVTPYGRSGRLPEGSSRQGLLYPHTSAQHSYTFLKRHQGARAEARAGAPVGAKEVYSEPSAHTSKRLKDVQLTTQLC